MRALALLALYLVAYVLTFRALFPDPERWVPPELTKQEKRWVKSLGTDFRVCRTMEGWKVTRR